MKHHPSPIRAALLLISATATRPRRRVAPAGDRAAAQGGDGLRQGRHRPPDALGLGVRDPVVGGFRPDRDQPARRREAQGPGAPRLHPGPPRSRSPGPDADPAGAGRERAGGLGGLQQRRAERAGGQGRGPLPGGRPGPGRPEGLRAAGARRGRSSSGRRPSPPRRCRSSSSASPSASRSRRTRPTPTSRSARGRSPASARISRARW